MRKGEDPSAENPTVTKWTTVFAGFFGGFAMAAAAVQFYRDISALEAGTVRMVEVHRLVYSLYQLGGKWGVIGVLVLVALLLFALGAWALTWPSGGTPSRPRRHRRDPDDGGRPRVRARTVDHTPILVAGGVLAGLLLVQEAGGHVSDFLGDDGLTKGNPVLGCTPELREILVRVSGIM